MEIGTIGPLIEGEKKIRKRRTFSGGGPGKRNGGGGDGNDGGDDDPGPRGRIEPPESLGAAPDKAKIVTWFLLLTVTMTFGGMIGAYIVISTNGVAEWRPFELPVPVWISTALIILSSLAYHRAKIAVDNDASETARKWMIVTTALGGAFISSQLLAWLALVNRGLYMRGNPYAGFFYILTAAHAVHVLGGIVALGSILLRSWYPTADPDEKQYRKNLARSVGWYWHFMGLLWIVLFILLGFWK